LQKYLNTPKAQHKRGSVLSLHWVGFTQSAVSFWNQERSHPGPFRLRQV